MALIGGRRLHGVQPATGYYLTSERITECLFGKAIILLGNMTEPFGNKVTSPHYALGHHVSPALGSVFGPGTKDHQPNVLHMGLCGRRYYSSQRKVHRYQSLL